ncbi:hypothetical protein ACOSQ4_002676 [Xanthoceras sorbifolium]
MASSSSNTCQQTQSQQSQQSSTMDFGSLAKTLHFNLPIKLDEDNYIYWKTQILPAVNALDLEEYIDSSKHPPSQFISVQVTDESGNVRLELQPNKEYQKWKKSDQIMLFWLISTLSQKVVGQVTKCKSSLEAWSKLENLYSQKSMAKILNLRQQLQTIRKGSHSVSDFVLKIKNIGDVLSAAGEEVSERDLLLSLMHGVGHEYDAVVVLISSQRMTMSLEEAQFLLLMHEQRIEQLNSPNNFGGISANFVTNNAGDKRDHRGGSNYNRGGQRGRGRGGRFGGRKLYCQLCTKPGHHAFQCFHRFDQQFVRPQPSHYTNNNSHSNGQLLPISNVGSSLVMSHTNVDRKLNLKHILHVPKIKKNLLSISRLTRDNNVMAEFTANKFYPFLRDYSKNKLDFHTTKCVFIGYSLNHKGYWNNSTQIQQLISKLHSTFALKNLENKNTERMFSLTCLF